MLAERPHDEPALLAAPGILQQMVYNSLLGFHASLPLAVGHLYQRLEDAFDGQGLRPAEGEALLLLGFECHVSRVAVLVEQGLESASVKSADILQRLGDGRPSESKLKRDVRRADGVCGQPHLFRDQHVFRDLKWQPYSWKKTLRVRFD